MSVQCDINALEAELQQETYRFLLGVRDDAKGDSPSIDVWLQVLPDGQYRHYSGDAGHDDRDGYWGRGSVRPWADDAVTMHLAREMVAEVLMSAAVMNP